MYMKKPVNDVNMSYFSEAELRVVKLLASGLSEKEIADRLCISRHTVDNHLRNIRERFGLHKNTEIILLYIAHLNHKPFSLSNIKQYGLEVILVLINVCTYTDLKKPVSDKSKEKENYSYAGQKRYGIEVHNLAYRCVFINERTGAYS